MMKIDISKIHKESRSTMKGIEKRYFLLGFIPIMFRIVLTVVEFLIRDLCDVPNLINGKINLSIYSLIISLLFMICRWLLISPVATAWIRTLSVGDGRGKISDILFYYYSSFATLFGCLFFNLKFAFLIIAFISVSIMPSIALLFLNVNVVTNIFGVVLGIFGVVLFILLSSVDLWYLWEFLKGSKKPFKTTKKAVKGNLSRLFLLNLTFLPFGFLWFLVLPRVYILPRILTCFRVVDKDNIQN
ncbi:MAG: hypothetical protein IJ944_01465 [Clostridia bacterium]|nr:hypothetical protein [Clostridia bacterium]